MRYIERSVEIQSEPQEVWRVLSDTARFPDWNPFILKFDGALGEGNRATVVLRPPGGRPMTFRPRLLRVQPPRELRWLGRVGIRGIFDGEHAFQIQSVAPGRVRLVQSERFSGLLVPLLRRTIDQAAAGFEAMNEALRARVEAGASTSGPT